MKKTIKNIDLSKGTPWKVVLLFAFPIILATLLTDAYSFTDSFILGKFAPTYFSGASSVTPIINLFVSFMNGVALAFSSLTSKYYGARDEDGIHKSFLRSLILQIILETVLYVTALLLLEPLLKLINVSRDIDPFVFDGAYYKALIILSTSFIASINVCIIGQLRAIGDGFSPLLFSIIGNVVNIIIDIIMAFALPDAFSKLIGILLATTGSTLVEFLFIILFVRKKYPLFRFKLSEIRSSMKGWSTYLKVAIPVGLQWSMIAVGFIALQGTFVNFDNIISQQTGIISHDVVNGKSAAAQLITYLCTLLGCIGSAIMSFTAQNYGAKKLDNIKVGIKQFVIMMLCTYGIINFFTFFIVYNGTGLYIFLNADYVNDSSKWYFSTFYLIQSLMLICNAFVMIYRNILQGIQKTVFPLLSSIGELAVRIIISLFLVNAVNPSNPASRESYVMASFSDPIAWVISCIILISAATYFIYSKKSKLFLS